jgi:hypothetical protein
LNSPLGSKFEELLNNPAFGNEFTKYKQESRTTTKDLFRRVVVSGGNGHITEVQKSIVPFDEDKMVTLAGNPTKEAIAGTNVYRLKAGSTSALSPTNPGILAFPHKTIALTSNLDNSQLESMFKSKKPSLTGDLLTLVNKGSKGAIYGGAILDAAARQHASAVPIPGLGNKLAEAMQNAKGIAFWLTIGQEVELKVGMMLPDAGAAQKVTTELQGEITKQASAIKMGLNIIPGLPPTVKAMAEEMLGNLQCATDETFVVVTTKVHTSTLDLAITEVSAAAAAQMAAPRAPKPAQPPRPGPPRPTRRGSRNGGGGAP